MSKAKAKSAADPVAAVRAAMEGAPDAAGRAALAEQLRAVIHDLHPNKGMPVDWVRWVPITLVSPNEYNPNSVARVEMKLLYISIKADGYTQPVVVVWNLERQLYEIVDGFHRFFTMKTNPDLLEKCHGLLPIVLLDKGINDRMASTVRHNRARGKHSVGGMSSMVLQMLENGWANHEVCNELGMSPEELLRLKHVTGFSKLFQDAEYQKAWLTERQIKIAQDYKAGKAVEDGHANGAGSDITAAIAADGI